jgi:hypothetical protein
MPRTRQRGLIDNGLRLDINVLIESGLRTGTHQVNAGESKGTLSVSLEGPIRFVCFEIPGFNQTIGLTNVPRFFGGVQRYFFCPMTGDRASVLWMPRGQNAFASRKYWQMRGKAYSSQFLDPVGRAERRIEQLEARLVYNEEDELMYKPKRMRHKTFDRICVRLDDCEAVRDDRLIRVLARLMKRL